jgi:hypothetical protein
MGHQRLDPNNPTTQQFENNREPGFIEASGCTTRHNSDRGVGMIEKIEFFRIPLSLASWKPRFIAVGGCADDHTPGDCVGMIGKNSIF